MCLPWTSKKKGNHLLMTASHLPMSTTTSPLGASNPEPPLPKNSLTPRCETRQKGRTLTCRCTTHSHHSGLLLTSLNSTDFKLSYSRTVSQSNQGWNWGHKHFTHCGCSRCPSRCQSHLTPSWDKQNCSQALPNFSSQGKGNPDERTFELGGKVQF